MARASSFWTVLVVISIALFGPSPGAAWTGEPAQAGPVVASGDAETLSLLPGPPPDSPPPGQVERAPIHPGTWGWEGTDRLPDPRIRFGRLENGMRYAIDRRDTDERDVSLAFHFRVGSRHEEDSELGYAHLLEHMAFNGSASIPEGELVSRMQALGMAFGRDVNAFTSFHETQYSLDLSDRHDGRLELALLAFRETADRLLLDQEAIDREKGVVINEAVARDSASYQRYQARQRRLQPELRQTWRHPIGDRAVVAAATSASLRAFYQRWYRPERALLVIAGDVDVDATEAMIRETFGSWRPALDEPDPADPPLRVGASSRPPVDVDITDSPRDSFVLRATRHDPRRFEAPADAPEGAGSRIFMTVTNLMLWRLRQSSADYISHGPVAYSFWDEPEIGPSAALDFRPVGNDWRRAVAAVARDMRLVLRDGFTQQEFDDHTAFQLERASEPRPDTSWDDHPPMRIHQLLFVLVSGNMPVQRPEIPQAERLEHSRQQWSKLTLADVNAALRYNWQGSDVTLDIETRDPSITPQAVMAVWREALAAPMAAFEPARSMEFIPVEVGPPGALAAGWHDMALEADIFRFANGVTLVFKPNDKPDYGVSVRVQLGAGELAFGDNDGSWAATAAGAWERGGYANIELEGGGTVSNLAGLVSSAATIRRAATSVSLSSRADRLGLALQVALAQVIAPHPKPIDSSAYAQIVQRYWDMRAQDPSGVLGSNIGALYMTGSPRFEEMTLARLQGIDQASAIEKLQRVLNEAEITVIVAGDVDHAQAVGAVAETFGALAPRPGLDPGLGVIANWQPVPGGGPVRVLEHTGSPDKGLVEVGWQLGQMTSGKDEAAAYLLGRIFDNRVLGIVREAHGQTYSPQVQAGLLSESGRFAALRVTVEVLSQDIEPVAATIRDIARDLARDGPSDAEWQQALAPELRLVPDTPPSSDTLVWRLGRALEARFPGSPTPSMRPEVEVRPELLRLLTREDVAALAARALDPFRAIEVHVVPAAVADQGVPAAAP